MSAPRMARLAGLPALLLGAALAGASPAAGPHDAYGASGQALTLPFELSLRTLHAEPGRLHLAVRGWHERSTLGQRWLACQWADLAREQGAPYWNVRLPEPGSETAVLGLGHDPEADPALLLGVPGQAHRLLSPRMIPTARLVERCGLSG